VVQELADTLVVGNLLDAVRDHFGSFEIVVHWTQGEFHHDLVLSIPGSAPELPGPVLVVATNCNGGIKEVLCFGEKPDRSALWHWRCPDVEEFSGALPPLLDRAVTIHWFDPCQLLLPDARSELKEESRQRQPGGGWEMRPDACGIGKKPK
jgi:hypothetical protein